MNVTATREPALRTTPSDAANGLPETERLIDELLAEAAEVDAAGGTHAGHKRPGNEDAFAFGRVGRFMEVVESSLTASPITARMEQAGWFAIVADGMGGRAAGEIASRAAIAAAFDASLRRESWKLRITRDDVPEVLERMHDLIAKVHAAVSEHARSDPKLAGMGTTFSLALLMGSSLLIGHVGDSRIYLQRKGVLRQLTKDQTHAQLLADMDEIRPEEVARHSASHILTQAIGTGLPIKAEVRHIWILDGDAMLLATDGLTGVVDEAEIAAAMTSGAPPRQIVDRLIVAALAGGGPDNVTLVFARVHNPPARPGGVDSTGTGG